MRTRFKNWLCENVGKNVAEAVKELPTVDVLARARDLLGPQARAGNVEEVQCLLGRVSVGSFDDRRSCDVTGKADHHRLLASAANLVRAANDYYESGGDQLNILVSGIQFDSFCDAVAASDGISVLCRSRIRQDWLPSPIALLRSLGVEIAHTWASISDGEVPAAPMTPDARYCGPRDASGSEFIYRVLRTAGWDFTRAEVLADLDAINRHLDEVVWGGEASRLDCFS